MTFDKELGLAVQDFYQSVRIFNRIANGDLSPERFNNQLNTVVEEAQELVDAVCLEQIVDAVIDSAYTGSELLMISMGDDSLTLDPPKYAFNQHIILEEIGQSAYETITDRVNENYVATFLDKIEDMIHILHKEFSVDMVYNLKEISRSNLSKFVPCAMFEDMGRTVNEEMVAIESQGRYQAVTCSIEDIDGVPHYVFKAKYDLQNGKEYPLGKVVKPTFHYFEPQLKLV